MVKHTYINHSAEIFQGFYESKLYNSDMLYYENQNYKMPEGYEFDIKDFNEYKNQIGKCAVEILDEDIARHDCIKSMTFSAINSPKYYNFTTDKLVIDMDINEEALAKYCFEEYAEDFDGYLCECWSSRDGFISFVPNNIEEFKEWDDENKLDVMIEYHLLNEICFEEYEEHLNEFVSEILWESLALTDGEDMYDFRIEYIDEI